MQRKRFINCFATSEDIAMFGKKQCKEVGSGVISYGELSETLFFGNPQKF